MENNATKETFELRPNEKDDFIYGLSDNHGICFQLGNHVFFNVTVTEKDIKDCVCSLLIFDFMSKNSESKDEDKDDLKSFNYQESSVLAIPLLKRIDIWDIVFKDVDKVIDVPKVFVRLQAMQAKSEKTIH